MLVEVVSAHAIHPDGRVLTCGMQADVPAWAVDGQGGCFREVTGVPAAPAKPTRKRTRNRKGTANKRGAT